MTRSEAILPIRAASYHQAACPTEIVGIDPYSQLEGIWLQSTCTMWWVRWMSWPSTSRWFE